LSETFEKQPETGGNYEPLGAGELLDHDDRGLRVRAGATTVEVAALAPDLFRVGMFPAGALPRYDSEGIAKEDWGTIEVSMQESEEELTLSTTAAIASVSLNPLRIRFADHSGRAFAADDEELGMGAVETPGADVFSEPLGSPVRLYKRREAGERYFGCGERTSGLEKTGTYQIFYNVDPPLGHTASFNNLYSSIPFTFSITNGKAHGLFFDNTHRVEFDLALEDENRAYYGAEGGAIVYYVFCGPTPREVVDRYTELTGRTPMPPLWTLGNQQCRYSYMNEEEVREVARGFRERDIPCDVIYLDIHYMEGYRVFTWNEDRFPDPRRLISDLREQGFRVVTIVDPGVKVDEYYSYTPRDGRGIFTARRAGARSTTTSFGPACAPSPTSPTPRRASGGERTRGFLPMPGWPGSGAT
jgi:alpha-glucosidase